MPSKKIGFLQSGFVRKGSRVFMSFGGILLGIFPNMGIKLKQSGIATEYNVNAREYLSICFFLAMFAFMGVSLVISGLMLLSSTQNSILGGTISVGDAEISSDVIIGPIFGAIVSFFIFIQLVSHPNVIVNRRVRDIDRNLLFVLRTILVQIRSGVPIFYTFVSIANGDYGEISLEFKGVIEKVGAGKPVIESLEELAVRNPSTYFRKSLWQLVNALKSGSDVGDNLENVISALSKEQIIEIRQYQSTLNPLAMMYMMIAVIVPSLGITLMIILSTFPGMEAVGSEDTFWLLLIGVAFMQFLFMSVIKSKRPNLMT